MNANNTNECNEPSVDEGAFWHTNMDLYYGYLPGEVVEVEHEPDKYWLATIQYCFKHLVLLKWVGNYGSEFWVDTSVSSSSLSSTTSSSGAPSEPFSNPKRLYSLGHHLQAQLKSQFKLEKPTKILEKPSLYNPSKDPYASIQTVDDLLVHEVEEQNNDDAYGAFCGANKSSTSDTAASIALAKCKNKINYGQEDEDELEAALQSLTGGMGQWECNESPHLNQSQSEVPCNEKQADDVDMLENQETSTSVSSLTNGINQSNDKDNCQDASQSNTDELDHASSSSGKSENIDKSDKRESLKPLLSADKSPVSYFRRQFDEDLKSTCKDLALSNPKCDEQEDKPEYVYKLKDDEKDTSNTKLIGVNKPEEIAPDHDEKCLELCKTIQNNAMTKGRYLGADASGYKQSNIAFPSKPRLLFDVGGANHERLFVRGTLLSVCHTIESSSGQLNVFQWFAFVVKNVGGRLTLRWLLCDEPKFKQGRLEMRSCFSKFVTEESEEPTGDTGGETNSSIDGSGVGSGNNINKIIPDNSISSSPKSGQTKASEYISAKSLTFSMHFCNPRIHTIALNNSGADSAILISEIEFKLPNEISNYLLESHGEEFISNLEKSQQFHVFDARRINLDRDRPLINHILSAVRSRAPLYLDLIFCQRDTKSRREVLMSCPKRTKLLRACVKRELAPGVYEIHSEPLDNTNEIIKFIYPYDSSYTILPLDWSVNHQDCLSIHPSRNVSPTVNSPSNDDQGKDDQDTTSENRTNDESSPNGPPLQQANFPLASTWPFELQDRRMFSLPEGEDLDSFNPTSWSDELRKREPEVDEFQFHLDYRLKEAFELRFKVMDQLEIVHPSSDSIICSGRIRKVVFPLLWIQLSSDCYTLVPFDLTDIYPVGWCETNEHKLISLLPPRRRCALTMETYSFVSASRQGESSKRSRKKVKISQEVVENGLRLSSNQGNFESENFDLVNLEDRQAGIDYILNEKSAYIKIFFNHKCFTGPSLSKSKICTLPQYVGPGPMRLVIEEVVTKLISVAYVPPRVLNDLCSKSFEELLVERNLTNTTPVEFKAKYQKKVHRDTIPVCLNPDEVALYCECICEHIKCCYNLFGLNLYDGDFCPSNCRSLTKSNRFMKRATYYRDKARQGEAVSQQQSSTTVTTSNDASIRDSNNKNNKKKAEEANTSINNVPHDNRHQGAPSTEPATENSTPEIDATTNTTNAKRASYNGRGSSDSTNSSNISRSDDESESEKQRQRQEQTQPDRHGQQLLRQQENHLQQQQRQKLSNRLVKVDEWTTEDVAQFMDESQLGIFKAYMQSEGIDGQALMLLDRAAIEEHFQMESKSEITQEDVNRLCDTVDCFKSFSKIY